MPRRINGWFLFGFVWVCLGLLGFSKDMGHPWPLSKAKRLAKGSRKLDAEEYRDGEMLGFGDIEQIYSIQLNIGIKSAVWIRWLTCLWFGTIN
jgi:hypothetical protein